MPLALLAGFRCGITVSAADTGRRAGVAALVEQQHSTAVPYKSCCPPCGCLIENLRWRGVQAALTACTVVRLHHDDDDVQAQAAGLASAEEFGDL